VLASDHEKATRLTAQYTQALGEHWGNLSVEERAASSLPKQSLELLTWVREMTLMQRAMAGQHLKLVAKSRRYQTARELYLQSAALGPR
jgi:hypothetical protein